MLPTLNLLLYQADTKYKYYETVTNKSIFPTFKLFTGEKKGETIWLEVKGAVEFRTLIKQQTNICSVKIQHSGVMASLVWINGSIVSRIIA